MKKTYLQQFDNIIPSHFRSAAIPFGISGLQDPPAVNCFPSRATEIVEKINILQGVVFTGVHPCSDGVMNFYDMKIDGLWIIIKTWKTMPSHKNGSVYDVKWLKPDGDCQ